MFTVNPILMDRRQELVFIGVRMNRGAIVAGLDRCLVTRVEASRLRADPNERLRQDEWKLGLRGVVSAAEDPFPRWPSLEDMNLGGGDEDDDHDGHHHGHGHRH